MRRWVVGLAALLLNFSVLVTPAAAQDKQGGGVQQGNQGGGIQPMCVQGCLPPPSGIDIWRTSFVGVTLPVESGPYFYTITFHNRSSTEDAFLEEVTCTPSSVEIQCSVDPGPFTIPPDDTVTVLVTYSTRGRGTFAITTQGLAEPSTVITSTGNNIKVTGTPLAFHLSPLDSMPVRVSDSIIADVANSSGINSGTIVSRINYQSVASSVSSNGNGAYRVATRVPSLVAGYYQWETYACTTTGRCESTYSTIYIHGAATTFSLDDSLPPPDMGEVTLYGLLAGALPLPPADQRGCPVAPDHPEIRLVSPSSYFSQPGSSSAPGGLIFMANVQPEEQVLEITANTIDHTAAKDITCADFTYLEWNQYDWSYWLHSTSDELLWEAYDFRFGGRVEANPGDPEFDLAASEYLLASRGPNVASHVPDGLVAPVGRWLRRILPGRASPVHREAAASAIRHRPASMAALPSPGAIKPSTYTVSLNGVLIISGGEPVPNTGVVKVSLDLCCSRYTLPASSPLLHSFDPQNITADQGGWNEIIATIADSTGHATSVRTRFPVVGRGPAQPLVLTPLRDLTRSSQADCAAFGAFQCGSVFLTQAIPGYMSRDKERSLHLVYRSASQRGMTILPVQLGIDRLQAAPDSLHVRVKADGVWVGDSIRYAGVSGAISGTGAGNLWEGANELRVVGAELPPASPEGVKIRTVEVELRGFYGLLGTLGQSFTQEVVTASRVDTAMTRFGAGWALAEQSLLAFGDSLAGAPAAVWVSGDGSYLVFRKVGTVWTSPAGETAKLVTLGTADSGASYVVTLADGVRLGYSSSGHQVWAADLIGNKTTYTYGGTRLTRITDPSGGQFKFAYDAATPGQVARIYAKGPAQADSTLVATLGYESTTRRLRRVDIPVSASQTDSTVFTYLATSTGAYLATITDPRSTTAAPIVTTFTYDQAAGYTPVQVQRPVTGSSAFGAIASYRDPWRRAVPRAGYGRNAQPLERMIYPSQLRGTYVSFENRPTDFKVDRFDGPTWVRYVAPEPVFTFPFPPLPSNGDVVRHIERDTMGRVIKIVSARDSAAIADSVMYQYDALSRVVSVVRNTAKYPILANDPTLDTLLFTYDSVTVSGTVATGGGWCSRLLKVRGVMGSADTTVVKYGASGAGKCLPLRTIGIARDSTIFTYGSLAIGNAAATRPISIRDPNGIVQSATYHSTTWNSLTYTKPGGGVTTFYDGLTGRPDSLKDPAGARTFTMYDRMGRVTHQKTGTGATAPTTRTIYLPGGLVSEVQVYASADGNLTTPSGTVQSTKTYFDRIGQVDSVVGPGQRSPTKEARKQSFEKYAYGKPTWVYGGNGTLIGRVYDDQGRVKAQTQFPVDPSHPLGSEPFAGAATKSFYLSLPMLAGSRLSAGQTYNFTYDNDGHVVEEEGYDNFLQANPASRYRTFSRVGALVRDVAIFAGGLRVTRAYEYNRRGQRTVAADTVTLTGAGTLYGEKRGKTTYTYDATTGRLTSVVATVDTASTGGTLTYATAQWYYDRGGRDTLQVLTLAPNAGANAFRTRHRYWPATGLDSLIQTTQNSPANTWYSFGGTTYSNVDDLKSFTATEPGAGAGINYSYTYSTDGMRRLLQSARSSPPTSTSHTWLYDAFGNRLRELRTSTAYVEPGTCDDKPDTLTYGADNRLATRRKSACTDHSTYYHDQAGNRIAQRDTVNASPNIRTQFLTYTAANQLYFSLNAAQALGSYNADWHWYDGSGLRVMTHSQITNTWNASFQPDSGVRTYYFYDGADVALSVVRTGTGSYWVGQRYLTGGLDRQLAGRFATAATGTRKTLALIADRQGSTLVAVQPGGTIENNATFVIRGPFGTQEGAVTIGSINTQLGYTGASAPSQSGGYTYLRNRWYDPRTGRFLTQDPIGLEGGVNLYAYAGNNPIAFQDPFGLCEPNDAFCLRVLAFFRKYGGDVAAPIVQALDRDEWKLTLTSAPQGGTGTPGSVTLGHTDLDAHEIEVNESLGFGQQIVTINHEFWQHALPCRKEHSSDGSDPMAQQQARTLSNLREAPGVNRQVILDPYVKAAAKLIGVSLPDEGDPF